MIVGLFVWKNACRYLPLESYLSAAPFVDRALICYDPSSTDQTEKLVKAIVERALPPTIAYPYVWKSSSPKGEVIGDASNVGLEAIRIATKDAKEPMVVCNVQADEVWHEALALNVAQNKRAINALSQATLFKVLNTEHNAQQFQGGGTFEHQNGSGYQESVKMARLTDSLRFAPDAWSFEGYGHWVRWPESYRFPILHAHHFFRDHFLNLTGDAARTIFADLGNYQAYHEQMESSDILADPKWAATTSPLDQWMPALVKPHLGKTRYEIRWELLG